ncbi:hypothetical protein D3C71_935540 [compost metagenome]
MKKSIVLVLFALLAATSLQAQVGINTSTPDSSAALDIQSPSGGSDTRGVLFPRMTSTQRTTIANPAQSLIVFDTDSMMFYYRVGTRWVGLTPTEPIGTSGVGAPHLSGDITLNAGTISAPNMSSQTTTTNTLAVPGFSNNALVPPGVIVMWSGAPNALPSGWALCNGNYYYPDGTIYYHTNPLLAIPVFVTYAPNLSGRFIAGYDPAITEYNNIGNQGGTNTVTLAKGNIPKHTHVLNNGTDGASFSDNGSHTHLIGYSSSDRSGGQTGTDVVRSYPGDTGNVPTSNDGGHRHTGNTGDGTTDGLGAAPLDTRPPYFVLAYIIKLQ